jgi:N-ethylmaleimide reductase
MMTTTAGPLFAPTTFGALALPNRVVMSPMTRLRADASFAPTDMVAEYYAQRASAGMIVTESIMIGPHGDGFGPLPGLYTAAQREGWRRVVERVHVAGGRIVAQLASLGRARFESRRGAPAARGWAMIERLEPHHFTVSELAHIVDAFAVAADAARAAGFDGVEIHNGNGFLFDQFLRDGSNARRDQYGGSLANRQRLTLEIVEAVASAWTADRVGLRLSPSALVDGAADPTSFETFSSLLRQLQRFDLAYTHLTQVTADDRARGSGEGVALRDLRPFVKGGLVGTGDFTRDAAALAIEEGWLDAVGFGRLFLANPDLPARFADDLPLNTPDNATFYSPGAKGYVDYPRWERGATVAASPERNPSRSCASSVVRAELSLSDRKQDL